MAVTEMSFNTTTIETITHSVNANLKLESEDEVLGPILVWTFIILRAIQGIFAMAGNLITMIAVFNFEFLWENSACRMIAALAFADFCGGVVPFGGTVAKQLTSSISRLNALCYVQVLFNLLTGYGNVYCTLLCTIDRCIFITRPLRYQSIVTPGRASWAILIVWILIVIQIALILALAPSPDAALKCSYAKVMTKVAFYETLAQFVVITFCVIVPIYVVVGYTSWTLSKNEPHISNYPPEAQGIQKAKLKERKMAKTIGLVLGTYLICYTPFLLGDAIIKFSIAQPFPFGIILLRKVLNFVYNMQGILNPFIYSWKNAHFRKAYNKFLPGNCRVDPIQ